MKQRSVWADKSIRKKIIVLLVIAFCVYGYYNLRPYFVPVPERPDDFEIVFKYGVGAKNILDTREGTFTRDMIVDTSITIQFTLTGRELETVWAYIQRNHFYELEEQDPARAHSVSPIVTYVLFVHAEGYPDKEVSMNDLRFDYTLDERRFFRITWKIRDIIESKPEYKSLPEPRGAYA